MKKAVSLCLVLVLLLTLTACVRYEMTVKVNSNGTADIRILLARSDALASMTESESIGPTEEEIEEFKEKGFTYEEYVDIDSGYYGCILSRQGIDLRSGNAQGGETDMNSLLDGEFDDLFRVEGKHVIIDFEVYSEDEDNEMLSYIPMIKNSGGYMKFNLELPVKPTSNNATTVSEDGKTLTWDLTRFGPGDKVHAEFDIPSKSIPVWLYIIIGVIAAVLIIAEIVDDTVGISKKKKSKQTEQRSVLVNRTTEEESFQKVTPIKNLLSGIVNWFKGE